MLIMTLILSPAFQSAAGEAEKPAEQEQGTAEHQVAAEVAAPHALLMEVSTGTVLMGKAEDEKLHPASVTKIMTLLLMVKSHFLTPYPCQSMHPPWEVHRFIWNLLNNRQWRQ